MIKLQADLGNEAVRISVDDNGKGFDVERLKESASLGLELIRERTDMLGGGFEIDSMPGKGARITFFVPVQG
jgi:signal transduction histidine kinase